MSAAHERHNRLTSNFILQISEGCHSPPELMVVLESIVMGGMMLLHKQYKIPPQVASASVEEAVLQAIVRFSKKAEQERLF